MQNKGWRGKTNTDQGASSRSRPDPKITVSWSLASSSVLTRAEGWQDQDPLFDLLYFIK